MSSRSSDTVNSQVLIKRKTESFFYYAALANNNINSLQYSYVYVNTVEVFVNS